MLSLQLKSGDYLTIGENVVVQVFKSNGAQFRVSIQAPREIPIVRGDVREREGDARPDGLLTRPPKKSLSSQVHDAQRLERHAERKESQANAIQQLRTLVDGVDDSTLKTSLLEQLARLEN